MRVVALLASLAVATAAITLPTSFLPVVSDTRARMASGDRDERDREDSRRQDGQSESAQDDDLDERFDDLDDLAAVLDHDTVAFVPRVLATSWVSHVARSPRSPHREDTLRPPIAA